MEECCAVKKEKTFMADVMEQIEILHTESKKLFERAACVNDYLYDEKLVQPESGGNSQCAYDNFMKKASVILLNIQAAIVVLYNI